MGIEIHLFELRTRFTGGFFIPGAGIVLGIVGLESNGPGSVDIFELGICVASYLGYHHLLSVSSSDSTEMLLLVLYRSTQIMVSYINFFCSLITSYRMHLND